jgi:uncharacterized membrane protein required for colicin V production
VSLLVLYVYVLTTEFVLQRQLLQLAEMLLNEIQHQLRGTRQQQQQQQARSNSSRTPPWQRAVHQ